MNFRRINKQLAIASIIALYTVNTFAATPQVALAVAQVTAVDVNSNHWAYQDINYLKNKGIITYNRNNEFFPNNQMTYFEVAQILANATGYVNLQITPNVDETFKAQLTANYNKQKPIIDKYAAGKSGWDSIYTHELAYVLGRGYIKEADLNKFMTTATSRAIMTKEDLAVYIVRILGKEVTAQNTYKAGAFKDENLIKEENRPHMAYLRTLGFVNPDANGNCNPQTKVTKALAAKMVADAVRQREAENPSTGTPGTDNSGTTEDVNEVKTVTFKKMLPKNNQENYVLANDGTKDIYYSVKNTLQVKDINGAQVAITDLKEGQKLQVICEFTNNTNYITQINLMEASGNGNVVTPQLVTVTGQLTEAVESGIIRVLTGTGEIKVYMIDSDTSIIVNGKATTSSDLGKGDTVKLKVDNAIVKEVTATKADVNVEDNNLSSGEITGKKIVEGGLELTIKKGSSETKLHVPKSATIKRNDRIRNIEDLRIGDEVSVTRNDTAVTAIVAKGEQSKATGVIKEIHIAQTSKVIARLKDGSEVTYIVNLDTEIYDINTREYLGIRDLHLGQEVELLFDSKELIGIDVVKTSNSISYKGTVKYVSTTEDYMDVVVDYDPITEEVSSYKRMRIPVTVPVYDVNNKKVNRNTLAEDMEVIVFYEYLDDTAPQKIMIIK